MSSPSVSFRAHLAVVALGLSAASAHALQPTYDAVYPSNWQVTSVSGRGTWETTLQARDIDGNGSADAYYDTTLDVTWLRDAVETDLHAFDSPSGTLASLSVGGVTGWRLPGVTNTTGFCSSAYNPYGSATACGYNAPLALNGEVTSELAHLWTVTLGNVPFYGSDPASQAYQITQCDEQGFGCVDRLGYEGQVGWGMVNGGDLNFQAATFWIGNGSLVFNTTGFQGAMQWWGELCTPSGTNCVPVDIQRAALIAVHDGDVFASQVPEPSSLWLTAAGLLGLALRRERQRSGRHVR